MPLLVKYGEPLLYISSRIYYTHLIRRAWSNILQTVHVVHTSFILIYIYTSLLHSLFNFNLAYSSILLSDLGPLHLRIRQIPLELLVRDPVVEGLLATVRSN